MHLLQITSLNIFLSSLEFKNNTFHKHEASCRDGFQWDWIKYGMIYVRTREQNKPHLPQ